MADMRTKSRLPSTQQPSGEGFAETFMQNVWGRVRETANHIGAQAMDDVKMGFGRGWRELRGGMDGGIDSATEGMKRAWRELADGIDRALAGILPKEERSAKNQ